MPYSESMDEIIAILTEDESAKTQTFSIKTKTTGDDESDVQYVIGNKIDGLEALKQSIYLQLSTEADRYIIYPYTYGLTTFDLIGKSPSYVCGVLPNRISMTLLKDDRIKNVTDFMINVDRNKIHLTFTVNSIYGDFSMEKAVRY